MKTPTLSPLPSFLRGNEPSGIQPGIPVAQYELGPYRNFVYLIIDWVLRTALIVDPAKDLAPVLHDLEKYQLTLHGIALTHSHHDHIAGVPGLLALQPELPIFVHEGDLHRLKESLRPNSRLLAEGEHLPVSKESDIRLRVIHAPGHSAGELCLLLEAGEESYLLTGDTLFIRDCGRTDLPSGNDEEMFATLQKLKKLPARTIILPGHHYTQECASRLGVELETSPPLRCETVEELAAL